MNARKTNTTNRGLIAQARLVGRVQTPSLSTCKKCGLHGHFQFECRNVITSDFNNQEITSTSSLSSTDSAQKREQKRKRKMDKKKLKKMRKKRKAKKRENEKNMNHQIQRRVTVIRNHQTNAVINKRENINENVDIDTVPNMIKEGNGESEHDKVNTKATQTVLVHPQGLDHVLGHAA
eukprot:293838_1